MGQDHAVVDHHVCGIAVRNPQIVSCPPTTTPNGLGIVRLTLDRAARRRIRAGDATARLRIVAVSGALQVADRRLTIRVEPRRRSG